MNKYINILYIAFFFVFFTSPVQEAAGNTPDRFTVVIDPGHGGNDPGAIGRRGKEKNINLTVALKLGKLIERNCGDTRVVYTRKNDVFIPLHRRAEIANNAKADLFISIHTNSLANRNSSVSGTETYTLGLHRTKENLEVAKKENAVILIEDDYQQQYAGFNPNSAESYIIFEFMQDQNLSQSVNFASAIQHEFRNNRRTDRGVHQAGFLVLRATSMPSVLIELGYISNQREEQYLLSDAGSTTLAKSIYQAFLLYKEQNKVPGGQARRGVSLAASNEDDSRGSASKGSASNGSVSNDGASKGSVSKGNASKGNASRGGSSRSNASAKSSSRSNASAKGSSRSKSANNASRSNASKSTSKSSEKPIFKIQILTSSSRLPANSRRFKGLSPVEHYKENGIYKYTYGSTTDYNHIRRIKRNQIDIRFKDAFIIALKNGKKVNVHQAIEEFKRNRK